MTGGAPAAAERLVVTLRDAGRTCAVAESLTGGQVLDALVSVPGASACVRGGVVAYQTDVKERLLGVDGALLARHGAVHPDVAAQMAGGVRRLLDADLGLATTGVAGPDGQDGHPPGTVHVAVAGPDGVRVASLAPRPGDGADGADGVVAPVAGRARVRARARDAVLALALEVVTGPWLHPGG